MTRILNDGDVFPTIEFTLADGSTRSVPDLLDPRPILLTFYRGNWCRVCRNHLKDLQSISEELKSAGALVAAASTESLEEACSTINQLGLTFPVAYGLDASEIAKRTGAFYHPDENYLHATAFALKPNGTIVAAVYSTGARGRFTVDDWKVNLSKALK